MFLTLKNAREKLKKYIGNGSCTDADVDARINEVISHLLREGNWKLTIRRARFYVCDSVLTLPREFDKILAMTYDHTPLRVFSKYYEFLEGGPGRIDELANTTASDLVDLGEKYPIMKDIPVNETWKIAAFSTEESDTDLTIKVRGVTSYNNTVLDDGQYYKTIPINRYHEGIEGSILNADTVLTSADAYSNIHQIVKPVTKGYVTLYAIDTSRLSADQDTDPAILFLGKYYPDETVPSFRRYKIMLANTRNTPTSESSGNQITALVKMALIDAIHDDDILLIQDLPALKLGCMAMAKLEADEFNDYKARKNEAIGLLHRDLMDHEQEGGEINVQMDAFAFGGEPNII